MQYDVAHFTITPNSELASDILCGLLGNLGFDSFEQHDSGVEAYIERGSLSAEEIDSLIEEFPLEGIIIDYTVSMLEERDWNEEWERNGFTPIVIPGLCAIHDITHSVPKEPYDIVINPRMAFGSGTHATTSQLVQLLLNKDFEGKSTLDMGCGTGILAICMAKRGANSVDAIDVDGDSVANTMENSKLNQVHLNVIHGDASSIVGMYDLIVANIHRNIIVADMPTYVQHIKPDGHLIVSGFFTEDVTIVSEAAKTNGLRMETMSQKDNWAVIEFVK